MSSLTTTTHGGLVYNKTVWGWERSQLDPRTEGPSSGRREHAMQVDTGDVSLSRVNGVETDGVDGGYVDDVTLTRPSRCKEEEIILNV